jgi:hypothetical protein
MHTLAPAPKKALWLRLRRYQFEHLVPPALGDHIAAVFGPHDASARAFAGKLRRKLGWDARFALRALDEYRKFVFLGVTGDAPVTPSKVIDQVWHEHLLFTKPYREFCRDVLAHDFDHHPELVPVDTQTETFSQQYEETLRRYVQEFNVLPPPDIWGTPKFTLAVTPRAERPTPTGGHDPLYLSFDGRDGGPSTLDLPEFGGGGGFDGGGGGDAWGGDAGGDAGSGTGCSSSCGGGCGGD